MKTFLGLDVSLLRIGAACITSDGEIICAETHTFSSSEWVSPALRAEAMEDLRERHKLDPSVIGLEAVFVGPNKLGSIRAAMALGQVESVCDYEWPEARQKVLTAAQWRKYCGIEQRGKAGVMEWARAYAILHGADHLSLDQDAADALAIAYAAMMWDSDDDAA